MSSYRMKYKIGLMEHSLVVPEDISAIPLGTILPYSANTLNPPAGYLFCDGSAVSRSMYPDLFALIGTLYGAGDGVSTFNLPNLLGGKFLEGTNSAGTSKSAGLPNITGNAYHSGSTSALKTYATAGAFTTLNKGNIYTHAPNTTVSDTYGLRLDASRCSAIYGNSETVQPSSVTVRYIIKAFNSISNESSLVDVTQYASELNQRYDIRSDMTIIYPNGGTVANPANVSANGKYYMDNPFSGYRVHCVAEIYLDSKWSITGWYTDVNNNTNRAYGVIASQFDDNSIVVCTGVNGVMAAAIYMGSPSSSNTTYSSLPCRVKVWKIGRLPS